MTTARAWRGTVAAIAFLSSLPAFGQSLDAKAKPQNKNPFAKITPATTTTPKTTRPPRVRRRNRTSGTTDYHGRRAWTVQNNTLKILVTPGGGHIASVTLKSGPNADLNPLWLPPWQSVEPTNWQAGNRFGGLPAGPLLSGIMGHNICVDFFGAPSDPEAKAGVPVHGEAPTLNWTASETAPGKLTYHVTLPKAQMRVTRSISLPATGSAFWITETVENLTAFDRPFGWQQHPSFGPPFLAKGETFFDMPATKSTVSKEFSKGERLKRGEEFEWPNAPTAGGEMVDLREWPKGDRSSDYTASIIDPSRKWGFFTVVNVKKNLVYGYVWPRADWPWVGNWEENHFRDAKPWLKKAVVRGMEFGTTPFPDSRRSAVSLSSLHGVPTYRWISAGATQTIGYGAFLTNVPAGTTGVKDVQVAGDNIKITLDGVEKTLSLPIRRK